MIEVVGNPEHSGFEIIEAKSNLSISLDRLTAIFLALSTVTLLVALGPTILGLWPILLVALLHLVLVGWCLRMAWRGNWALESLAIGPDKLEVTHYRKNGCTCSQWPLAWVRVAVENERLGEQRVYLCCQGKRLQLGSFLPVAERLELAEALQNRLLPHSAWRNNNQAQVS